MMLGCKQSSAHSMYIYHQETVKRVSTQTAVSLAYLLSIFIFIVKYEEFFQHIQSRLANVSKFNVLAPFHARHTLVFDPIFSFIAKLVAA